MALAFRSVGARAKVDTSGTSGTAVVSTPAGFAAGDLLLWVVLHDCNVAPTMPAGWVKLAHARAGVSAGGFAPPQCGVYSRIATGAEGASQTAQFPNTSWPSGQPDVLSAILSWTGADPATPVEQTLFSTDTSSSPLAEPHPVTVTATVNDWLISIRARSGAPTTFTVSVGTDAERVDDTGLSSLSFALYDSNTPLATGTQVQRTTTAAVPGTMGEIMFSVAIRPAQPTGAVAATAGVATAAGTAQDASAAVVIGGWDLCTAGQLPQYTWAIDWDQSGLAAAGRILTSNPYTFTDVSGWVGTGAALSWTGTTRLSGRTVPMARAVPDGVSVSGGVTENPRGAVGSVVPGRSYTADCWVWTAAGSADVRACVDWYTAADAPISTSLGSASSAAAGTWTHLVQSLTAPATASRAAMRFRYAGTPPSSQVFYVFGLLLMDPSLPETRITPGPNEIVGTDMLSGGAAWAYGRDQMRQLSPAALGTASFSVDNSNRVYSPENAASPLSGTLDAARPMTAQVVINGAVLPLFSGRVNDYSLTADRDNRTVDFSFLDLEALFQNNQVTTPLYSGLRTGAAIGLVLDAAGWTGPRDLDLGATVMPWWWLSSVRASDAVNDLVKSEGPPAVFYMSPDGTPTFRDRTHRLLRSQSLTVQGTYAAKAVDCAAPAVTGLSFSPPFTYQHGWRDIINDVVFQVEQREVSGQLQAVWSTDAVIPVSTGQTVTLAVSTSDPFLGAVPPVAGTDFTFTGGGTVGVTLGQTSGTTTTLLVQALGADAVVTGMQLRAYPVPVARTVVVSRSDPTSALQHGTQSYPESAPWAGVWDADAVAETIVTRYAQRRPLITVRLTTSDPTHYDQVLRRTVSDLVHVTNGEVGIDAGFFVERVAHTAQRMNWPGRPPVHSVVLGCEQSGSVVAGPQPFTFDLRGAGFDQGVFDPPQVDDASTVWIWDDPVQGAFDIGRLGT